MGAFFGDPGIRQNGPADDLESLMPVFNAVRNRDLQDFQAKGQISNDLAIRQARTMSMFNPDKPGTFGTSRNTEVSHGLTPQNTDLNTAAPPALSPADQAQFGLRGRELDLEGQKVKQSNRIGEERLGILQQKADLDQQKSDQIYGTKIADLQRKHEDAASRLDLAQKKMEQTGNDFNTRMEFLQSQAKLTEARHALELAQRDKQNQDAEALHKAQIDHLNAQIDDLKNPKRTTKTTETNADGTKKTETTSKEAKNSAFSSSTTKAYVGKDGTKYNIPMDKIDAFLKDNPDAQEVK
jgi:hypothetical protein